MAEPLPKRLDCTPHPTGTTIGVTMLFRREALAEWTKSSYSAVNGDCVEVKAQAHLQVRVRDSKDIARPGLGFSAETWVAFVLDVSERKGPEV
ncbi:MULTISPECIES: DUF397 domain-containing protein [unclassified Streptomyces]|uniref:DUF397 domain-containing protein n=1 Tax=unclassified Streptomyces TaxID=2593676 RepID=UPI0035DEBA21